MAEVISNNEYTKRVEDKFQAALSVIKSLPKNGSYKPSPEMMLKFYSYYKQATEGPCTKAKPWAWDVINKAKWDAWSKLGDMPRTAAMENYVDALKEIVEAMPVTEDVENFIKILGNFYEVVELEPPKQFHKKTSTPLRNHNYTPAMMNGNAAKHVELNGHSNHLPANDSHPDEKVNGHSPEKDEKLSDMPRIISEISPQKSEESSAQGRQMQSADGKEDQTEETDRNEVHPLPSDSEDEFCDTAEDVQLTATGQHASLESKDSLAHSYTMVNSDDQMGSSSSAKSDSLSTLDETLEGENNNSNLTTELPEDSSQIMTTSTVRVRKRGGETGTRGTDNQSTSSFQRAGNPRHSGVPSRNQENMQYDGRNPQQFGSGPGGSGGRGPGYSYSEVQDQIATTLLQLQQDMNSVLNRLTILEALTVGQQARRGRTISDESNSSVSSPRQKRREIGSSSWWPFPELSPKTALFIILWPFVARWIFQFIKRRHSRLRR